jgi:hypothetical protein
MRSEARIFNLVGAFIFLAAGTYAFWTDKAMGVDWIGTFALLLSGTLCAMCGFYFGFVARRIPPRPEDRPDGEIADAVGEIGFFSPASYWPLGIAMAAGLAGVGLVYRMGWLIILGLVAVIVAVCGLMFEYYTGTRRDNRI